MAFNIGATVFYDNQEEPGKGSWSALVGRREWKNGAEMVYITFDGVQVPATCACGIQGPDPSKNWLLVPFNKLTCRQSQVTDGGKQVNWEKTVAAYKTKTGHYDAAKRRFASAKPGVAITCWTNVTSWDAWVPPASVRFYNGTLVSLHFDIEPGYAMVNTNGMDGIIHVKLEDVFLV